MTLLKLASNQVRIGQPLPFGVRDEHGQLLLAQGQVIDTEAQLAQLLARGSTVDEAEVEHARRQAANTGAAARKLTLFDLWTQSAHRLERLIASLETEANASGRFARFADDFLALVRRDVDIAIYMAVRQDPQRMRQYGLTHALHVAVTACLISDRLAWDASSQQALVKAALTMNLAIVELQGWLATHGGRPTENQMAAIRSHPSSAAERLGAAGIVEEAWLRAVAEHHEQPDGSGYPSGMATPSEGAVALRLADVFMAKISPRVDRPGLPIQEAARQMFKASSGSPIAAAVVKEFGIYPPGDFVQLASGEMAVVIRRGADARTPQVACVTDRSGMPIVQTVFRDTRQAAHAITGPARDPKLMVRVPPERLYGLV